MIIHFLAFADFANLLINIFVFTSVAIHWTRSIYRSFLIWAVRHQWLQTTKTMKTRQTTTRRRPLNLQSPTTERKRVVLLFLLIQFLFLSKGSFFERAINDKELVPLSGFFLVWVIHSFLCLRRWPRLSLANKLCCWWVTRFLTFPVEIFKPEPEAGLFTMTAEDFPALPGKCFSCNLVNTLFSSNFTDLVLKNGSFCY